jgi:hypothetical protein
MMAPLQNKYLQEAPRLASPPFNSAAGFGGKAGGADFF